MFRTTLDQRKPDPPEVTNDDLRLMIESGDGHAKELLNKRMRRYAAAANMNSMNRHQNSHDND